MAIYLKRVKCGSESLCSGCYFDGKGCPDKATKSCTAGDGKYILIQIEKPEEKQ